MLVDNTVEDVERSRAYGMGYSAGARHQRHKPRRGKPQPQPWYRAEVVQVTPKLIFAIADKEFKFDSSTGLIMTATARAKEWKVGMQAAALLHGAQLLVLDSL